MIRELKEENDKLKNMLTETYGEIPTGSIGTEGFLGGKLDGGVNNK